MADANKVLEIVLRARDEASQVIEGMGNRISDLANRATVGATIITGALSLTAKSAVQLGADMQSARVSFETFLGSGEKAGKLLAQLSDFAVKTPFDLPQVVDGTKRLLAYGVAADDIIPTFRTLGDLSSGNKVRLDQLTLAYGQVKAATKLTGAELRQFTEAGVPMLEALAAELNKNGGALKTFGGASKGASAKAETLNRTLEKQNNRLVELASKGKEGSATYKNLAIDIEANKNKLEGLTTTTATYSKRVKVTAADVKEMISDGGISFEQVDSALKRLNSEGGRFFNNMENQSKTFNGVMSNTRDEFARFAISVLGFTKEGEIRQGSIFYYLQIGAEKMLITLQTVRPIVQQFVDTILANGPALMAIFGALVGLMLPLVLAFISLIAPAVQLALIFAGLGLVLGVFIQGLKEGNPLIIGLTTAIALMAGVILVSLIPAFVGWAVSAGTAALATLIALAPVIIVIGVITAAVTLLAAAWKYNWGHIREITQGAIDFLKKAGSWIKEHFMDIVTVALDAMSGGWITKFKMMQNVVEGVKGAIEGLIRAAENMANRVKGGLKIPGFQHGGFVQGGFDQAVPAMLHGGERVVPRIGTDVNTGGGGGMSLTLNFSGAVNMDSDSRVQELADKIISILGRQNELASRGLAI
jgi:tape measure domain-containing protein